VGGIDRSEEESAALEVVRRVELHLSVHVGPVRRKASDELIPLLDEWPSALGPLGRRRTAGLFGRKKVETSPDALGVESSKHAPWVGGASQG
jgi:hypothetical protein